MANEDNTQQSAAAPPRENGQDASGIGMVVFGLLATIGWVGWWGARIISELHLDTGHAVMLLVGVLLIVFAFLGSTKSIAASVFFIIGAWVMAMGAGRPATEFISGGFIVKAALAIIASVAVIGAATLVGYGLGKFVDRVRGRGSTA